jgi:hypothetical protein
MRPVATLVLLALLLPGGEPPTVPTDPTVPATELGTLTRLREALPQAAWIVEREGGLWWQCAPEASVRFAGVDADQQPQIEVAGLAITVSRRLIEAQRPDAIAAVLVLAPMAAQAGIAAPTLTEGPLTGLHLRTADAVVLPEGVLRATAVEAPPRGAEADRIRTAAEALKADLPGLRFDEQPRRAINGFLDRLSQAQRQGDIDELDPAMARRLVRSGWIRQFFPGSSHDESVERAVREAEAMTRTIRFAGEAGELAEVRDAFGRDGWILRTPTRSARIMAHPQPLYVGLSARLMTVTELAPGSDPLDAAVQPTAIRLWQQRDREWTLLAQARSGEPLVEAETGVWRKAVPPSRRDGAVADALPLHAVVTNLHGDVLALVTAQGWLASPRDASPTEGERFLAEAARQLPDAAHLDLVGQYLMQYVYDSPDPRFALLVGDKQNKGDIHQTALQTLASAAGGIMRGDCDDAAELYETIAERQGRTAHVISLPAHAACAWAEKHGDTWSVFLLQTGPAYQFSDTDLKQALTKCYKHFDESDAFDPNGLSLLLRFDNENQRGGWRLSYRIFEDPEYARLMIDVQRDWHYQTYARGIAKMQQLIAGNQREKDDTANWRELSGLFSFTGQHALAAEAHQKAIDLMKDEDAIGRLSMRVELIGHLFDAGKDRLARDEAIDLLEHAIPAQRKTLGPALMQLGSQLAGVLATHGARDLAVTALMPALQLLDERMAEALLKRKAGGKATPTTLAGIQALGDWLEGPEFDERVWEQHPVMEQFRRLCQMLSGTAIATLEGTSAADLAASSDLQALARMVQIWLDRIAFRDIDDPAELLFRYAAAGETYELLLSPERFASLVAAAPAPKPVAPDRIRRIGGLAQMALDAGWMHLSVPYQSSRLFKHFDPKKPAPDTALVRTDAKAVIAAYERIQGSDLDDARMALQAHLARVILAMIDGDDAALRACLQVVVERSDKDWRDMTAQWLGDAARAVPPAAYAAVLKAWDDVVQYKPKYYWIAWRACLAKADQQAVMAAELACRRYPDEASFSEELVLLREVIAQRQQAR